MLGLELLSYHPLYLIFPQTQATTMLLMSLLHNLRKTTLSLPEVFLLLTKLFGLFV